MYLSRDLEMDIAHAMVKEAIKTANGDTEQAIEIILKRCEDDKEMFDIMAKFGFDVIASRRNTTH